MTRAIILLLLMPLAALSNPAAQEIDRLGEARKLYESAEYARALSSLERIEPAAITPQQALDRLLYQALCLLALENQTALDTKIQEIVRTDPFFDPGGAVPPRLRALVSDMRNRMRPGLVQAHYQSGKERFEAGDHASAVQAFTRAIQLAQETGPESDDAGMMADIKLLAEGFRDLARRALESPPAPDGKNPLAAVIPPAVVQQNMPPWPASLTSGLGQLRDDSLTGILQIVITKTGEVGAVTLVERIHPVYDALLIAAAREWKYQPATLNGEPIEFVKRLNVKVSAR